MASAGTGGCEHYRRQCRLVSPCCQLVYSCRFCHDEREGRSCGLKFNRFGVKLVECVQCKTTQRVGRRCMVCGLTFGGAYFCVVCRLYDNEDKQQFHCVGCGICRVGGRENFFHCMKCGLCLHLSLKGKHKCKRNASHHKCVSCHEDLHSSRIPCIVPPCGHLIHKTCYEDLLQNDILQCRICKANFQR